MNRFRKAWLALTGRLEPQVKLVPEVVNQYILGEPEEVEVFRVTDPRAAYAEKARNIDYCRENFPDLLKTAEWHGRYYATCEQAFAECPGADVKAAKVYRDGRLHFAAPRKVEKITIQPKPKVAKGRK